MGWTQQELLEGKKLRKRIYEQFKDEKIGILAMACLGLGSKLQEHIRAEKNLINAQKDFRKKKQFLKSQISKKIVI